MPRDATLGGNPSRAASPRVGRSPSADMESDGAHDTGPSNGRPSGREGKGRQEPPLAAHS